MTLTHPTLTLADQLVTVIRAGWTDRQGGSDVTRRKDAPVTEKEVNGLNGRQVFVRPLRTLIGPGTVGKREFTHAIAVLTVERYGGQGLPPEDWSDERAQWVFDHLATGLDFAAGGSEVVNRETLKFAGRSVHTRTLGEFDVCVWEYLPGHSLFWCELEFGFGELL